MAGVYQPTLALLSSLRSPHSALQGYSSITMSTHLALVGQGFYILGNCLQLLSGFSITKRNTIQ